jgi:lipooligosaccharide transport system permease protein
MRLPVALRPLSYFWTQFMRTWKADIGTTFLAPVLYLASLGLGLGALVGHGHALPSLGGEDYLSFVAPALLAANAMQVAISHSTYDIFGYLNKWNGTYRSMQASPLSVDQIMVGQLTWIGARVLLATAFYLVACSAFGTVRSPAAAADLLVGPLVGVAFAAPVCAYAVTVRHDQPFSVIFRLVMMPLFLFSGTFFPVSQLPLALRYATYALPLWHGVELSRSLYTGNTAWTAALGHAAYLVAFTAGGVLLARYSYRRRMAR